MGAARGHLTHLDLTLIAGEDRVIEIDLSGQ